MLEIDKYVYRSITFSLIFCCVVGALVGFKIANETGDIPVQLAAFASGLFGLLIAFVTKSK